MQMGRLHARLEASKWQHSDPGKSICILASSQNADGSSGATRDCMPEASKWQHSAVGKSICILASSQNADGSSGATRDMHARPEASKWQHSAVGKSICILASSQNADGSSGATRGCMPDLKPANDSTALWESPSAFWPARKMQMSRLVSSSKDTSPSLSFASISSRCYLSTCRSAVEMQIICVRAARQPPCRQGWTNTSLLKVSLVRCSQAYGHQRLHATWSQQMTAQRPGKVHLHFG